MFSALRSAIINIYESNWLIEKNLEKEDILMKWLALHIDTSPAGLEPVETMLSGLGIDSFVIEDEADFRHIWYL